MQHSDIKGFTDQSEANKAKVNKFKDIEERTLQLIDALRDDQNVDQRSLAVGTTQLQQAFMWLNRSIFQPQRFTLDDPDPIGSATQAEADKAAGKKA